MKKKTESPEKIFFETTESEMFARFLKAAKTGIKNPNLKVVKKNKNKNKRTDN